MGQRIILFRCRCRAPKSYVCDRQWGYFTPDEWFTLCFAVGLKCLCCGEKKPLEADMSSQFQGRDELVVEHTTSMPKLHARKGIKSTDTDLQRRLSKQTEYFIRTQSDRAHTYGGWRIHYPGSCVFRDGCWA